jgi:aspartyl-tRNA(Asn)/glutamyl-tRNA(Gln) amidotransferase subunit C
MSCKGDTVPLSRQDVAAIANYARIGLTDAELDAMTSYMNDAIALLDPILEYDIAGVEPTYHPIGDLANVARDDAAAVGLSLQEALTNAPDSQGGYVRVPAILGEGGAS